MKHDVNISDVTPESLMNAFHGPKLSKMVALTIIVHAVVILGTSVPYLLKTGLGVGAGELSKEERLENAVADATSSLQKIANQHGLSPKDISDQFGSGKSKTKSKVDEPAVSAKPDAEPSAVAPPPDVEKPSSAIEQELEKKAVGPVVPDLSGDIEAEEDLFK